MLREIVISSWDRDFLKENGPFIWKNENLGKHRSRWIFDHLEQSTASIDKKNILLHISPMRVAMDAMRRHSDAKRGT
jgi:hypothetical protein